MVAERLDIANVMIWGMPVGVVAWQGSATGGHGTFQYHRSFLAKGLELSPIHMGIKDALAGLDPKGNSSVLSLFIGCSSIWRSAKLLGPPLSTLRRERGKGGSRFYLFLG